MKQEITYDDARQIHKLADAGYGRNMIGHMLDINPASVRSVLAKERVSYCDKLSTRQRQALLNHAFRPIDGR